MYRVSLHIFMDVCSSGYTAINQYYFCNNVISILLVLKTKNMNLHRKSTGKGTSMDNLIISLYRYECSCIDSQFIS